MQRRYCWELKDLKPKVKFPLSESQYAEKEVEVLAQKRASASPASYHRAAETVPPWELGNRGNRGNRGRRRRRRRKKEEEELGSHGGTECYFVRRVVTNLQLTHMYIMCLNSYGGASLRIRPM